MMQIDYRGRGRSCRVNGRVGRKRKLTSFLTATAGAEMAASACILLDVHDGNGIYPSKSNDLYDCFCLIMVHNRTTRGACIRVWLPITSSPTPPGYPAARTKVVHQRQAKYYVHVHILTKYSRLKLNHYHLLTAVVEAEERLPRPQRSV